MEKCVAKFHGVLNRALEMCNGLKEEVSRLRSLETVAAGRARRMKRMAAQRLTSLRDSNWNASMEGLVVVRPPLLLFICLTA